jgi:hypothetical protein
MLNQLTRFINMLKNKTIFNIFIRVTTKKPLELHQAAVFIESKEILFIHE